MQMKIFRNLTASIWVRKILTSNINYLLILHDKSQNIMLGIFFPCFLVAILKLAQTQACQAAHNRIIVGGVCVCMNGFYDTGAPNCLACSTLCLTCTSTATTCTSCDSALFLTLSGTTCICIDGYVMILGVCQPCHYSCKTCSGLLSTNCLTCTTSVRLFVSASNTCVCLNGTYDNTTLMSCQPCNSKCLWCTASTQNDCTACDSNLLRAIGTSNPGPCICYLGYYDTTAALCPACSYTCATCTLTAVTCVTCNSAYYRSLAGTSCSCIAHYYDANTATCIECSPRCGNCSTSSATCLTCNNTLRVLTGTNCPCIDGYYQDATITCLPCTSYCKTCENTSSTCLSCYNYGNRALYNATCPCIPGYYDNGTIICLVCQYQCLTCAGPSPATCLSCSSSAHRTLSGGACPCDVGYYDSGVVICVACSYSCMSCSSSAIMCTSCDASAHRTLIATDCNCTIGYYDDGVNAACQPCHYSCISCFSGSSTSCYTCQLNRNYTSYSCPCFFGMYELAQYCYNCDPSCVTCVTSATFCTSCLASQTLVNGTCVCSPGFYLTGTSCSPCSAQCFTCMTTSTTCTSCDISRGSVLSGSSCICLNGYYKNTTTLLCDPCHVSCLTCLSSLTTACLTCNSTNYRTLVVNQCVCIAGYFESGIPACTICHNHCTTCFGPTDYNCSGCVTGYVLIGSYCRFNLTCSNYLYSGTCMNICPAGTYGSTSPAGNICLPCINNCLTCSTSTYCLSCINGTSLDTSTYSCIDACPSGQYLDPTRGCLACPPNCSLCAYTSKRVVCTQCSPGFQIRDGGDCVSTCVAGYIAVAGRCHRCVGNCLTCSSLASNGCLACQAGYYLLSGACYEICPLGYTPNLTACSPCPSSCSTCLNNACQSCSTDFYLNSAFECIAVGYFTTGSKQIKECHPNCKSCTDTSFSSCLLCSEHRGDFSEFAVSGYCECKSGSIDTGDGKCDVSAYQSIMNMNEVLIGGTEAVLYLAVISSIVSSNYVPLIGFLNYLQTYSIFYYLNSSAVMQTDLVLESYQNANLLTYYRAASSSEKRLLVQEQTDESLFYRGRSWEYPIQWGLPVFVINCLIWMIALFLCCCSIKSNKIENEGLVSVSRDEKDQKCSLKKTKEVIVLYLGLFKDRYVERVPIVFFLLTYSEIGLYSLMSFKTLAFQMHTKQFQLNTLNLGMSIMFCSYYVVYIFRLLVGCYRWNPPQEGTHNNPLGILFHQYRIAAISKLGKAFMPLQVIRNLVISVLMVFLSYSPNYQSFSCLITLGAFLVINLCICPYKAAMRIYFHFCDLLLTIQVGVLTYITALPEKSRILPSQVLLVLNFLQLLVVLAILCWVVTKLIVTKICSKKVKQKKAKPKQVLVNEESISNLADCREINLKEKQNYYDVQDTQEKSLKPTKLQPNLTPSLRVPTNRSGFQSEKITKKYRIKHKA